MERMKYLNKDGRGEYAPMNAITVLDFDKGVVFRYDTISCREYDRASLNGKNYDTAFAWNPDKESIEDFLTRMQHDVSNCQWMVHNHTEIASFVRKVYWD